MVAYVDDFSSDGNNTRRRRVRDNARELGLEIKQVEVTEEKTEVIILVRKKKVSKINIKANG